MEEDESDNRTSTITATTIATSSAADGTTTTTTIITTRNSKNSNNNNNPTSPNPSPTPTNRKIISYSQPLSNHNPPALGSTPRRSSHRKHSLDDDRSLFYPHYLSSPPPSFYPNLPPLHHHPHSIASSGGSFTLERVMCEYGGAPGTLPELEGNGGNTGVFRVPVRAPVHPARPPALELRPHPSRETQAGSFLRALAANGNQLWAGSESGLTMWNLSEMWGTHAGEVRRGDEDSAPFYETGRTSPVICLAVDHASGFVWSGHKDGKIRSWKMDAGTAAPGSGFEDGSSHDNGGSTNFTVGLSWQAHAKDPVLSMVITSYGDIWTGSEGGSIRVWSWDAIVKSLSLTVEERHMAALLVERSFIDLRNQVTVNGTCPLPASDIKIMVVDKCRSRVWTATSLTFALWDARTRELLKVFSIDGQVETRVEAPPPSSTHESHPNVEDEMKVKFVSGASSKKEKSKDNFFQRSRNALMGAADAVRRVATKGAFVEDNRRISAVSVAADGTIWTGFTNGSLVQWDGTGARLSELQNQACSVQCICPFADRLWVGYASGSIQVMDLLGNLIGEWLAHSCPVIDMAVAGSYVFSLAHHGGVRGWHLTSPGPTDDILRNELTKRELKYTKMEQIKILAGTWNVGQEKAGPDSLISWLGTAVSDVGLVVVGLQEVEMGAGFLAMSAAKESVGLEGSNNGQWWLDAIGRTLDEGITFQRVGSRQLAGLVIGAWARTDLRQYIGDVDAAAIATGALGRTIGNKGAVGIRMRVYSRAMCFVNSHFAAHLEAVNKRNADFDFIYRGLSFSRPSIGVQGTQAGATSVQLHRAINTNGAQIESTRTPELSEADLVVFMGDFNYRLHSITYDEARDMVSQRCFDWLREKDQLWAEMKAGRVFQGMREAQITFPPTYKFQKHVPGLGGYDSGEKKRIPAWCDRILYRDSRSVSVADCSLRCPVVASITQYEACMDVADSDHKPVRCKFSLEIARTDEFVKRQEYGHIIKFDERIPYLLQDSRNVPETVISTNNIILQNQGTTILRITNNGSNGHAVYNVTCEGEGLVKGDGDESELFSRGSFGFPTWLEVHPAMGIIKPYQTVEVTIHHEEFYTREEFVDGIPQNWWCEDTRDKEVVLLVNVTGTYSTDTGTHRIHVRHCNSSKELCNNSRNDIRGSSSRRNQKNLLQRSDINQLEGSDLPEYSQLRML